MSCGKKDQCCKKAEVIQDYLVCTCMGVMKLEIIEAIRRGANTFQALSDELGVGTGCTTCVAEVHQILAQEKQNCE